MKRHAEFIKRQFHQIHTVLFATSEAKIKLTDFQKEIGDGGTNPFTPSRSVQRNRSYTTLQDEALRVFSSLQHLEGVADPVPVIQGVLQTGQELKPLRDELFCQLIKQTTRPPQPGGPGNLCSWKILACMSCTFVPTRSILRYLKFHLKRCSHVGRWTKRFVSLNKYKSRKADTLSLHRTRELFPGSEMDRYAAFALDSLRKTRARENVPSQEEIRSIVARQDMSTTVHCHGGGSCKITINSHTTAGEVGENTRGLMLLLLHEAGERSTSLSDSLSAS